MHCNNQYTRRLSEEGRGAWGKGGGRRRRGRGGGRKGEAVHGERRVKRGMSGKEWGKEKTAVLNPRLSLFSLLNSLSLALSLFLSLRG